MFRKRPKVPITTIWDVLKKEPRYNTRWLQRKPINQIKVKNKNNKYLKKFLRNNDQNRQNKQSTSENGFKKLIDQQDNSNNNMLAIQQ